MRRLRDKSVHPRQLNGYSYRYTHPDGHVSKANDWWAWQEAILVHIRGMGGEVPENYMAIAEDQLCGTIPPYDCLYETGDSRPVDIWIGLSDVYNWIKAVGRSILTGYVAQEEAERRAAICVACPMNVDVVGGCGQCHDLVEAMTPGMRERKTKQDGRLRSCAVCKCYGSVQVHFDLAVLEKNDTAERQAAYPADFCWKSKASPNYRP